jgi:predicted nucleic acid-binding protein
MKPLGTHAMPEVLFDTCVLSNFALSDSLYLIKGLHPRSAYVTSLVLAENLRGIQKGYMKLGRIQEALLEGWLTEVTLERKKEKALFNSLVISLGLGEGSAIAVAKARGFVFACDDRLARREANLLGVELTGTLGILLKAVRSKIISCAEADTVLKKMIRYGFYSPVKSLSELHRSP